jgi:serine/threonine protein kinase
MELLTGGTLRQRLDVPCAWQKGVSLLVPLCDALAYLVGASRLTRGSGLVGTPRYAVPEQIRGQPMDGRADVFVLTAVLYEVLTSQPLFGGDEYQVIYQIAQDEPVALSPPGLQHTEPGLC